MRSSDTASGIQIGASFYGVTIQDRFLECRVPRIALVFLVAPEDETLCRSVGFKGQNPK
jgi:hypothetical protein